MCLYFDRWISIRLVFFPASSPMKEVCFLIFIYLNRFSYILHLLYNWGWPWMSEPPIPCPTVMGLQAWEVLGFNPTLCACYTRMYTTNRATPPSPLTVLNQIDSHIAWHIIGTIGIWGWIDHGTLIWADKDHVEVFCAFFFKDRCVSYSSTYIKTYGDAFDQAWGY